MSLIRYFVVLDKIKRSDCHVDDKIRKKGRKKKLFPDIILVNSRPQGPFPNYLTVNVIF